MNVSTPVGKIVASLAIFALIAALEMIPARFLQPVDEYVSFVLTEDFDFAPWAERVQRVYAGLWDDWDWPNFPAIAPRR